MSARASRARYRRILRFASRHLASLWWYELVLPRLGLRVIANKTRQRRLKIIARSFQRLALDLSGLLIKLGQFMSTRLDVLPPEITRELEGLQDEVPAVPFAAIRALAERELGVPLESIFSFVDPEPLAAASLGQVHRAVLSPAEADAAGLTDVVIKIQRPGIDTIVDVDLRALGKIAGWLSRISLVNRRADAPALMAEFAATCLEEIDYLNEAANAERFAANFADNPRVRVPAVAWERTTRRVLTQEDVTDIKITDLPALRAAGIDPADVANEFAAIMFDQVFIHNFFHADPHPGNVFIQPLPEPDANGLTWRMTFIDFGMMGEVPSSLGRALRTTVIAAASRDGAGMVDGMREIGVLMPSADTVELERALTKVFDRFGGVSFVELQKVDPREFRAFASEFTDIIRALPFQFPENFLLVVRAISLTSGVCSSVNPQFNIWNAIEPYSAKLIRAEGGNVIQAFLKDGLSNFALLTRLPKRVDSLISRAEAGQLTLRNPELERRTSTLNRSVRRVISAVLFGVLFIGGLIVIDRHSVLGTWMLIVSAVPLVHALFAEVVARKGPLP
ncbi:putative unusual protein kinase regulating ubiquinone biosynthesis (AarF/ABC1/UbiB family) [Aurantimicrobium minutum]|uniref:ABC1 kinase family protein n=1 Tax=Aurantimicrobium minutum TaxID=708131 RepID=UPI0024739FE9|nr:AarF/UbiB family protein [Aurantimicrobium minutum]MDH6532174.1 putative unusual protein kinase regulating ubiquinone biosynthesis (AarF/ABC1/UbiB family) [Aurantimicrobium minutum]